MKTTNYTVLSLNMFGTPFHPKHILKTLLRNDVRKRFSAIAGIISSLEADFVLLQEVHDFPHYFFLRKQLASFPYTSYKKSLYGPRGGVVIFSKYPLASSHFYDFMNKGKIYNKSVTGYLSLKGILTAKLKNKDIWLFNTHLTQNSDHNWEPGNRFTPILKSQLEQLLVHTNSITNLGGQVILAGDFNMPKNTAFYPKFLEDSGLTDAFAKDTFTTYHQSFLPVNANVGRVDYILTSPSLKIIKTGYILQMPLVDEHGESFYASDHMGLLVTYAGI